MPDINSLAGSQDQPLVSVITIFLNEERFLQEAIDSVLAQSYRRWELLLIDDGSTDCSVAIAQHNAALHPKRIVYLEHDRHQNRGKSVSRNLGLQSASGHFVTFLDADDVFRPEKLERQTRLLMEHPVAMVYGHTLYWRDWENPPTRGRRNSLGRLGVTPDRAYPPPQLLNVFLRDGGAVPCICGLIVRKSVALDVGGFDERIEHLFEDQVFLAKICARYPVFVESGCWDQYRQHENSSSRQAIGSGTYHPTRPNPAHRAYLAWLKDYLAETGINNPELNEALHAATWPYRHPVLDRLRHAAGWRKRKQTTPTTSPKPDLAP